MGRRRRWATALRTIAASAALLTAASAPMTARAELEPAKRQEVLTASVQVVVLVEVTEDGETTVVPGQGGSGTVITDLGLILTNNHVIETRELKASLRQLEAAAEDQGRDIQLEVRDDAFGVLFTEEGEPPTLRYFAEEASSSKGADLAVLRISEDADGDRVDPEDVDLPSVALGDSDDLQIGDDLHIFGYPGIGADTITYTEGIVSGFLFEEPIEGRAWIKSDASTSGGSSGGTAVDAAGNLVGIPTAGPQLDCRPGDTNGDGQFDEQDVGCVPTGGSLALLRPVNLAVPLIEEACDCSVDQRRGRDAEPTDEPASDGENVDGNTYTSPTFGYRLEWDDEAWDVEDEGQDLYAEGRDTIQLFETDRTSYLIVEGFEGYDGDPDACLEGSVDEVGGEDLEPLEDEDGEVIAGAEDGRAFAAYSFTTPTDDEVSERVAYVECQTLDEGESVVVFTHVAAADTYFDGDREAATELIESLRPAE